MRLEWPAFLVNEASFALASAIVVAEGPATAPVSLAEVSVLFIMKLLKNIKFLQVC